MRRIYHNYKKWECWKAGLYAKRLDDAMIEKSISLLTNLDFCKIYFQLVPTTWKHSTEHNLTDLSINGRAFIGQSACRIAHGATSYETKVAWNSISKIDQINANRIADSVIFDFRSRILNKNQLCLKFI